MIEMPRAGAERTVDAERALALRLEQERTKRGLGVDALAKLMTEAGCPLNGSAIYRIEKGEPPRRISVDELVTFAEIFGMPVGDLLMPAELVESRRAQELAAELAESAGQLQHLVARFVGARVEYAKLSARDPELAEYVKNHENAATGGPLKPLRRRDFDTTALRAYEVDLVNQAVDRIFREVLQSTVHDIAGARTEGG